MGCDTKGFVLTEEKDPFKIWKAIRLSIFDEIKRETGVDNVTAVWGKDYTMPNCEIKDFAACMDVYFTFAGEDRRLFVALDCDHDYGEYKEGRKIILSLGAWGSSVQLVEVVLRGLSHLGETHILEDDCSGDWKELK